MPKHTRSSSQSHHRYSNPMPVSLAPSAPLPIYNDARPSLSMNTGYYSTVPSSGSAQPTMGTQSYDPYPAAIPVSQPPVPQRASSGAWTPQDDQNLLAARQQGLNWAQIQASYFPNKSPNACRKRHERLMERKGADDWDQRRLERLARDYMSMRKEIWQPLAAKTGEKWNVVESMCMSNGLKNLQTASRSASRRERLESGHPGMHGYDDDSGISGIGLTPVDDLDASYSSPAASSHSSGSHSSGASLGNSYGGALHPMAVNPYNPYAASTGALSSSFSSTHSSNANYAPHPAHHHSQDNSPYMAHGQRLPSVDMGIESIINRPGRRGQVGGM